MRKIHKIYRLSPVGARLQIRKSLRKIAQKA